MPTSPDTSVFASQLRARYGIELWLSRPRWGDAYQPHIVTLHAIIVPIRGAGVGTLAMKDLIAWADLHGLMLGLRPNFSGRARLKKFYKRFGFVPNKGRRKDFRTRDDLIRYPMVSLLGVNSDALPTKTDRAHRPGT